MLPLTKISHVAVHQKDWHQQRLGKFTSSKIGRLMGESSHKGVFTKGAISYIQEVAHEAITGQPYNEEVFTKDIEWGNAHEIEAIQYFLEKTGMSVLRDEDSWNTHRFIVHDEVFGSTPDALIPVRPTKLFNDEGTAIDIRTLEVKSPRKRFPKFYACITPGDLLKAESEYYYQKVSQMEFAGAAIGYWAAYHPDYPNKMRIIPFFKSSMVDEFTKFNATCAHAKILLNKTIASLKA